MSIGEAFNRGFREEKWRAPELMKNLLKECERLEQKFKDGQQLSEQCRLMKQEALQEASLRRPLPPADFLNYVPPTDIPPWDLPSAGKGRVPEPAEKGRVPEPVGKGKVPLHPQGTPPRNQPKQKARPKPAKPLPPPGPPPWARPLQPARAWQVLRRLPDDNPWEEDEPQARPVQPAGPLPDPWEQEWAPQPEPVQAAGPPPGRLLTPAEQFGMFPEHRQQARPAHPAQPPNVQEQPVQENRWGRNRVPEPAGPPPGRKAQLATKKAECQSLLDLHQDVKQDGRLLDTKKAECRSLLDRRRQSSLAKESPRPCRCSHLPRKLRRQVLLLLNSARHFRSTPRRMWRCPKSFQRSARPSRCAELGRKGRERQASGISGPQRKGQGHGPKGSGPRPTPRRKGPSR